MAAVLMAVGAVGLVVFFAFVDWRAAGIAASALVLLAGWDLSTPTSEP